MVYKGHCFAPESIGEYSNYREAMANTLICFLFLNFFFFFLHFIFHNFTKTKELKN